VQRADEYLALWGTSVSKLGVPVLNPRNVNATTTLIVRMGYFVNVAQLASRLAQAYDVGEGGHDEIVARVETHAEQTDRERRAGTSEGLGGQGREGEREGEEQRVHNRISLDR